MVIVNDKKFSLFIENKEIESRVRLLSEQISLDYKEKDPLIVVLLNGAFIFASDLIKNITISCQVTFIKVASYEGVQTTGKVTEIFGLQESVTGRNIIILDDIIDTGITMKKMVENLTSQHPSTIEIVSLLLKPDAFGNQFPVKYVGFSIPNNFVIGYGLDYNGYGRNYKSIYSLDN